MPIFNSKQPRWSVANSDGGSGVNQGSATQERHYIGWMYVAVFHHGADARYLDIKTNFTADSQSWMKSD